MGNLHLLLAALLLAPALAVGAGAARHPKVGAAADPDACLSCHADATPDALRDWESGAHGLSLVKCFVCHGSTGADFARRPAPDRCRGCHAAQVGSVTPKKGAPRACFDCHAPHTLAAREGAQNPHSLP